MGKKKNQRRRKRKIAAPLKPAIPTSVSRPKPRFTVAMATYNRADWVSDAIESVLSQSYRNFEYVIVDDGSTDNTPSVISAIDDVRVKYIRKDENEGRPATRNRVVRESSGEYILWMADDDRLAPDLLKRYDAILTQDPTIDVLYGNLAVFSHEDGMGETVYKPIDWSQRPHEFLGAKLSGSVLPDPGTATRLSIVKALGDPYDTEYFRTQDYELWTRLATQIKLKKLDEIVYFYRKHSESASFGDFVDTTFESKIIRRHRARQKGPDLLPSVDWHKPELGTAVLALRVATNLNIYRDGYNALRFAQSIENWHYEPRVVEEVITALCIQGRLDEAKMHLDAIQASVPRLEGLLRWVERIDGLGRIRDFNRQEQPIPVSDGLLACFTQMQKACGWTYDLVRFYAEISVRQNDLKKAALAYCYAARLNLDDSVCTAALEKLRGQVALSRGKLDLKRMRKRIQDEFVSLPMTSADASIAHRGKVSILDPFNDGPHELLGHLACQNATGYELVGFYASQHQSSEVICVQRPESSLAQLKALIDAACGDWFVLVESKPHLYPNFVRSILSASVQNQELDVIELGTHRCVSETDNRMQSLTPRSSLQSAMAAEWLPIHSFALSRKWLVRLYDSGSLAWTDSFGTLLCELVVRAIDADRIHYVVGASHYVEAHTRSVSPDGLCAFFRQYQKKTLFERQTRIAQNARLAPSKRHLLNSGRTTIAYIDAHDPKRTIAQLRRTYVHTFVPFKPVVIANEPSEALRVALSAFRDEHSELSAVMNYRPVVASKLVNQAFSRMNGQAIVLMSVNINLESHWLSQMLWHLNASENISVVCHAGPNPGTVDFRCVVLGRSALETVGGFDLSIPFECAAAQFLWRLEKSGLQIKIIDTALCTHEGEVAEGCLVPVSRQTDMMDVVTELKMPFAGETGFQPDAPPVQVEDLADRVLLIYPPWSELNEFTACLRALKGFHKWTILLRCDALEGDRYQADLTTHLAALNDPTLDVLDLRIVDAMLAPEREAGLFTRADAIYTEHSWINSHQNIRRALDCGCLVLTSIKDLMEMSQSMIMETISPAEM